MKSARTAHCLMAARSVTNETNTPYDLVNCCFEWSSLVSQLVHRATPSDAPCIEAETL